MHAHRTSLHTPSLRRSSRKALVALAEAERAVAKEAVDEAAAVAVGAVVATLLQMAAPTSRTCGACVAWRWATVSARAQRRLSSALTAATTPTTIRVCVHTDQEVRFVMVYPSVHDAVWILKLVDLSRMAKLHSLNNPQLRVFNGLRSHLR